MVEFIAFGNFIISFCAVSLTYQTTRILFNETDTKMLLLVFFATLSSYCFHAYLKPTDIALTERIKWISRHKKLLRVLSLFSLLTTLCLLSFLPEKWVSVMILAIFTLVYSLPRILSPDSSLLNRIVYMKIIYLTLIWTYVTSILPLNRSFIDWNSNVVLISAIHFLLIFQISLLFEFKDRSINAIEKKVLFFSPRFPYSVNLYFYLSFTGMLILSIIFYMRGGNYMQFISLFLPALYLLAIYRISMKKLTDSWYYLAVDGTLLLPGLIIHCFQLLD